MVSAILSLLVMLPSQRAESTETRVVLMASRVPEDDQQSMTHAVLAQVSDLDVFLDIAWFDEIPADLAKQVALAKDVSRDRGAAIVLWYDPRRADRLFIAVPRDPRAPVFSRRLIGAGKGGIAESVALICRGVVRAYLQGYPLAAEEEMESTLPEAANDRGGEAEAEAEAGGEIEVDGAPPVDPGTESPSLEQEKTDDRSGVRHRVSVDAGYSYSAWSEENSAVQGGHLAVGIRVATVVFAHVAYHFLSPVRGEVTDFALAVRRHPIALGARFIGSSGRLEIGAETGVIVDVVTEEVTARGDMHGKGGGSEVVASFFLAPRLHVVIFEWLRVFVGGGVEIPFESIEYFVETRTGRKPVVESWRARPIATAGFCASFL